MFKNFIKKRSKNWITWTIYGLVFLFTLIYFFINSSNMISNNNILISNSNIKNYLVPFFIFGLIPAITFNESRELYVYNFRELYWEDLKSTKNVWKINIIQWCYSFCWSYFLIFLSSLFILIICFLNKMDPYSYTIAIFKSQIIYIICIFICIPFFWFFNIIFRKKLYFSYISILFVILLLIINQLSSFSKNEEYIENKSLSMKLNIKTEEKYVNYNEMQNILSISHSNSYSNILKFFENEELLKKNIEFQLSDFYKEKMILHVSFDNLLITKNLQIQDIESEFNKSDDTGLNKIWTKVINAKNEELYYLDKILTFLKKDDNIIEEMKLNLKDLFNIDEKIVDNNFIRSINIGENGIKINSLNTSDEHYKQAHLLIKNLFFYMLIDEKLNKIDFFNNFMNFFMINEIENESLKIFDDFILQNNVINDLKNDLASNIIADGYNLGYINSWANKIGSNIFRLIWLKNTVISENDSNIIIKKENKKILNNYLNITNHLPNLMISIDYARNQKSFLIKQKITNAFIDSHIFNKTVFSQKDGSFFLYDYFTEEEQYNLIIFLIYLIISVAFNCLFLYNRKVVITNYSSNYTVSNLVSEIYKKVYRKK